MAITARGTTNTLAGTIAGRMGLLAAIVLAACLLALLMPLGRFISTSAAWLDYRYPRAGSEGLILYESLLLKHGGDIYAPITPERFISGPYPPIYYLLAAATLPSDETVLVRAGQQNGSDAAPLPDTFRGGRAISLLAATLAAAMIALIVLFEGRYTGSMGKTAVGAAGGIVGGIMFLTLPQTMVWATRFRGDMLMVALTAAGLLCIALDGRRSTHTASSTSNSNGRLASSVPGLPALLAAIFFALAFFTKQTALAGPAAAALYLLLRDVRRGIGWCMVMALAVGLLFLALDIATSHWFFLKMVSYHSLPLRGVTLERLLQFAFAEDQWPLILAAVLYSAYRVLMSRGQGMRGWQPGIVPLFTFAAFAFLPTGAVVGADHNHLLLPGLAIALATGAALAWAAERVWSGGESNLRRVLALAAVGLAVLVYALFTSPPSSWYDPDLNVPAPEVQEQYRKIILNMHLNPGANFFADDPGIVALAGKTTAYDDPFTMTALAQEGRWDEAQYRHALQAGQFSLLVLSCDAATPQFCRADTFTPGVLDSIRSGYRVLFRDILYTYAPK